jgi:hypothetical protein
MAGSFVSRYTEVMNFPGKLLLETFVKDTVGSKIRGMWHETLNLDTCTSIISYYGEFWNLGVANKSDRQGGYFLVPSSWSNMGIQSIKCEYVVPNMEL